jgi:hypothetical protein
MFELVRLSAFLCRTASLQKIEKKDNDSVTVDGSY